MDSTLNELLKSYDKFIQIFNNGEIPLFSEGGYQYNGIIKWNTPLHEGQISTFFKSKDWFLPQDLHDFYLIHNGGILFQSPSFGGGTSILSLDRIENIHSEVENIPEHWYPIAWTDKNIGSICIDSKRCKNGQYPYIFFLDAMDYPEEAVPIYTDFTTWLNRLLICQGEEYWLWDKYNKLAFK